MAPSTTLIRLMRAAWTGSGACTSGWIAPREGATSRASGGAATTSTASVERERSDLVPRGQNAPAGPRRSARLVPARATCRVFIGGMSRHALAQRVLQIDRNAVLLQEIGERLVRQFLKRRHPVARQLFQLVEGVVVEGDQFAHG